MRADKIVRIIAKKRAADIAKKKVAKIPNRDARKVAEESQKIKAGGTRPSMRPRGMGNTTSRPPIGPRNTVVKKIPKVSPEESRIRKFTDMKRRDESGWASLRNPPPPKPKATNIMHDRPRTLRQENNARRQANRFIKKQARLRQEIERTSYSIGKKIPEPRVPNRTILEREFNLEAGQEKELRSIQDLRQFRGEVRAKREARHQWKEDVDQNIIGRTVSRKGAKLTFSDDPSKVTRRLSHPSKTMGALNQRRIQAESDRSASNAALRQADRLRKKLNQRKVGTGGGRPNFKKPKGK